MVCFIATISHVAWRLAWVCVWWERKEKKLRSIGFWKKPTNAGRRTLRYDKLILCKKLYYHNFYYLKALYIATGDTTMQQGHLEGQKSFGKKNVKVNVSILFFEEDGIFYTYLPSMDLTGYGKTQQEATESLTHILDEFLRYTLNKNTFLFELQRLGWKVKSKSKPMTAPVMSDLINMNDQLKDIVNHKQYTTSNYQFNVPAFA